MIVVLKPGVQEEKRTQLIEWLKGMGLGIHISDGDYQTVLGLIGDTSKVDMDLIESLDIVDSVKRVSEPFKCCNRKFHPDDMIVEVGDVKIGGGNFCMIAGPCSVETEEQIVGVAKAVKASGANMLRGGAFKPRTSPYDFQGLKDKGIELLKIARPGNGASYCYGNYERFGFASFRGCRCAPGRRKKYAELRSAARAWTVWQAYTSQARSCKYIKRASYERGIYYGKW